MDLRTFTTETRGAASALAAEIGVPPALVSQWATGMRPVAPNRCVAIERATAGSVMRWDLRPNDWADIWPELVSRPDAPPVCDISSQEKLSILTTGSSTEPLPDEVQMSRRAA